MSLRSIATLICAAALVYSWFDTARADSASIGTTGPAQSSNHKFRFQAIVNGHNLQPRDDQLIPLPDHSEFMMYGNDVMDFTILGLCSM